MARVEITQDVYALILASFRSHPGGFAAAVRASGADWRTCKKAWETGWPNKPGRERPLREVIESEQILARARIRELEERVARATAEAEASQRIAAEQGARQDATKSRVQEAQLIRMSRGATTGLLAGVVAMTKAVPKMALRVQAGLEALAAKPDPLTTGELVNMVDLTKGLIGAMRTLAEVGQRVMEMDRLLLGEPTAILGVQHSDISMEEAERRIEAGRRALAYAREEGLTVDAEIVQQPALTAGNNGSTSPANNGSTSPDGEGDASVDPPAPPVADGATPTTTTV